MTLLTTLRSGLRLRQAPLALAAASLLFSFGSAHAASIVVDGGFENATGGSITGAGSSFDGGSWVVSTGTAYIETGDAYVYDGQNSLNLSLANLYAPTTVSQTLNTVTGQAYTVSFFANADSPNSFSLTTNGSSVTGAPTSIVDNGFPGAVTNSSLFQDYTGTFTATSPSTLLSFTDTDNPAIGSMDGSVLIDDVSVQAATSSTAVTPEPNSILLVFTGALGLGGIVRRRYA